MNIWDDIADQAHTLLTRPRHSDLTPAVTLVQTLHKQPPRTPAAICTHLATTSTLLPTLASYARNGDRHALLMAAVLMRHPLRRIANCADPDGYHTTDPDARDNHTLTIFFTLIRTAAEPQILTSRYLYGATLRNVLASRPRTGTPASPIRVAPHTAILDTPCTDTHDHAAHLLTTARNAGVITALEHLTLNTLYLHSGIYDLATAARQLDAKPPTVERRAQRAIRKLTRHYQHTLAAA